MSAKKQNLSEYNTDDIPNAVDFHFAIVAAEWNSEITDALLEGAYETLMSHGAQEKNIIVKRVPGTFELTAGTQFMAENTSVDAIISLGCVVQGDTPHFDYICQGVTQGITQLTVQYNIPIVFGVLTTNTMEQAQERAGGKHGNKGVEAAITAIKMAHLQNEMENMSDDESYYSLN